MSERAGRGGHVVRGDEKVEVKYQPEARTHLFVELASRGKAAPTRGLPIPVTPTWRGHLLVAPIRARDPGRADTGKRPRSRR